MNGAARDGVALRAAHVVHFLEAGGNGQDEVGEQRVVLDPLVVRDEALDRRVAHGVLEQEAAVPTTLVAGLLRPDHVYLGVEAFFGRRVLVLLELFVGERVDDLRGAPPLGLAVQDGVMRHGARDLLLFGYELLGALA